jgi:hypothetical protein
MNMPIQRGGHFYWVEMACADGTPYPEDYREDRLPRLLGALEAIRAECCLEAGYDVPLDPKVYRSPARQKLLLDADAARVAKGLEPIFKAAKKSQHGEGRAADIPCPRDLSWDQFVACVKRAASRAGSLIRYIEYRKTYRYIHVDTRPTQKLVEETVD